MTLDRDVVEAFRKNGYRVLEFDVDDTDDSSPIHHVAILAEKI